MIQKEPTNKLRAMNGIYMNMLKFKYRPNICQYLIDFSKYDNSIENVQMNHEFEINQFLSGCFSEQIVPFRLVINNTKIEFDILSADNQELIENIIALSEDKLKFFNESDDENEEYNYNSQEKEPFITENVLANNNKSNNIKNYMKEDSKIQAKIQRTVDQCLDILQMVLNMVENLQIQPTTAFPSELVGKCQEWGELCEAEAMLEINDQKYYFFGIEGQRIISQQNDILRQTQDAYNLKEDTEIQQQVQQLQQLDDNINQEKIEASPKQEKEKEVKKHYIKKIHDLIMKQEGLHMFKWNKNNRNNSLQESNDQHIIDLMNHLNSPNSNNFNNEQTLTMSMNNNANNYQTQDQLLGSLQFAEQNISLIQQQHQNQNIDQHGENQNWFTKEYKRMNSEQQNTIQRQKFSIKKEKKNFKVMQQNQERLENNNQEILENKNQKILENKSQFNNINYREFDNQNIKNIDDKDIINNTQKLNNNNNNNENIIEEQIEQQEMPEEEQEQEQHFASIEEQIDPEADENDQDSENNYMSKKNFQLELKTKNQNYKQTALTSSKQKLEIAKQLDNQTQQTKARSLSPNQNNKVKKLLQNQRQVDISLKTSQSQYDQNIEPVKKFQFKAKEKIKQDVSMTIKQKQAQAAQQQIKHPLNDNQLQNVQQRNKLQQPKIRQQKRVDDKNIDYKKQEIQKSVAQYQQLIIKNQDNPMKQKILQTTLRYLLSQLGPLENAKKGKGFINNNRSLSPQQKIQSQQITTKLQPQINLKVQTPTILIKQPTQPTPIQISQTETPKIQIQTEHIKNSFSIGYSYKLSPKQNNNLMKIFNYYTKLSNYSHDVKNATFEEMQKPKGLSLAQFNYICTDFHLAQNIPQAFLIAMFKKYTTNTIFLVFEQFHKMLEALAQNKNVILNNESPNKIVNQQGYNKQCDNFYESLGINNLNFLEKTRMPEFEKRLMSEHNNASSANDSEQSKQILSSKRISDIEKFKEKAYTKKVLALQQNQQQRIRKGEVGLINKYDIQNLSIRESKETINFKDIQSYYENLSKQNQSICSSGIKKQELPPTSTMSSYNRNNNQHQTQNSPDTKNADLVQKQQRRSYQSFFPKNTDHNRQNMKHIQPIQQLMKTFSKLTKKIRPYVSHFRYSNSAPKNSSGESVPPILKNKTVNVNNSKRNKNLKDNGTQFKKLAYRMATKLEQIAKNKSPNRQIDNQINQSNNKSNRKVQN